MLLSPPFLSNHTWAGRHELDAAVAYDSHRQADRRPAVENGPDRFVQVGVVDRMGASRQRAIERLTTRSAPPGAIGPPKAGRTPLTVEPIAERE
jgi:hypothetical protein